MKPARPAITALLLVTCLVLGASTTGCDHAAAPGAATAAACDEHGVGRCPFCDPSLLESMGFCGGHGVPEAVCTRCRRDLDGVFAAAGDWCAEHDLPESHCELCNPGTLDRWKPIAAASGGGHGARPGTAAEVAAAADAAGAAGAGAGNGDTGPGGEIGRGADTVGSADAGAADFSVVTLDAPRVQRAPALTCSTDASLVRLASPEVASQVGLLTEPVRRATLRRSLEVPATIEYDARAHARLAPRAAGTVVEVRHDLGAQVETGETLVVLDCAALGTAKAELLSAAARVELWRRNAERERSLLERALSTERDAFEAETRLAEGDIALAAAEQRLANLGLDAEAVAAVLATGDTSSLLPVRAPFAGTVIAVDTVLGETVTPDAPIVAVADTARMWVILDVDQADIRLVAPGQPVLLDVQGWEGETLGGEVTWISTHVDPRARTVKVRAEFANPEGHLRAQGFGTARIVTRADADALFVPKAAVQWEGCCNVAFERRSPTEFVPRKLRLGHDAGEHVEVLAGLSGGEQVVTRGSFLLKTELQKGSIGAGCCEVDHLAR